MRPVAGLTPYLGNARQHSKKKVRQIPESITRFGFTNPILISDDGEIVAGRGSIAHPRPEPSALQTHTKRQEKRRAADMAAKPGP